MIIMDNCCVIGNDAFKSHGCLLIQSKEVISEPDNTSLLSRPDMALLSLLIEND
jgi:hypothetical protein